MQLKEELSNLKSRFKKEILEDKIIELEKFIEDKKKELSELKFEVIE